MQGTNQPTPTFMTLIYSSLLPPAEYRQLHIKAFWWTDEGCGLEMDCSSSSSQPQLHFYLKQADDDKAQSTWVL